MSIDLNAIAFTEVTKDFTKSNVLIYGKPKVGKSTLGSQLPNALFVATEKGYNFLKVKPQDINSWQEFLELGQALSTQNHNFKSVIIDIADILYGHCEKYVMDKNGVTDPSELGFGKGFKLVKNEFARVIGKINMAGFPIMFISHAKEKTEKTKTGEWTVMGTSLSASAESFVSGLCDIILYCYITDEGNRVMRTKPTKYILAGDRSTKLPEIMPMDYNLLAKYLAGETTEAPKTIADKVPNVAPQMINKAKQATPVQGSN